MSRKIQKFEQDIRVVFFFFLINNDNHYYDYSFDFITTLSLKKNSHVYELYFDGSGNGS